MLITNTEEWAIQSFSHCELGDKRRTQRLVKVAANLAGHIGQSLVKSCTSEAEIEGAYRLLRNPDISSEAIAEAGFQTTAARAEGAETLLALEDSTSLMFRHGVGEELGPLSNRSAGTKRGFMVHSVLLVEGHSGRTVGLIEQSRWIRSEANHGKSRQRKRRDYEEKESRKWERASAAVSRRLGPLMGRTLSVCDRESDIYEYLAYKQEQGQRFVLRAAFDRRLAEPEGRLFEYIGELKEAGRYTVRLPQKGGRKGREAKVALSYAPVRLRAPGRCRKGSPTLNLYVVCCREVGKKQGTGLQWVLLTSEPVSSLEQARQIVCYYEQRWKIEEYHKAWKSGGTQVEKQRMQSAQNLERMAVILAFIAVRLLQLRELAVDPAQAKGVPCTHLLQPMEWQVLWLKQERRKLPRAIPSLHWAYYALAKLGGWYDSKRTGKVGWSALWEGWFKLEFMIEGAELSLSMQQKAKM